MSGKPLDGHACAVLSLTTRICWTDDLPQPLSRPMVRRMLDTGALCGLVLRDVPEIEEKWMERARMLLRRISAVHDCLKAYEKEGYSLVFPRREDWPGALHALGAQEPLFLFSKGNAELLKNTCVSVAGSRRVLAATRAAAEKTGRMIAQEGMTLVTGGACGVDSAAQAGAWSAGGSVVIVPAMPVHQLLGDARNAEAMRQGKLLLLCDALPDEPFSAQKALVRNHTIYALGCAGLVVAAREGAGGSWRGATDCLRGGWSPVFVWEGRNADTQGNGALLRAGAQTYRLDRLLAEQLHGREQISMF